jgi:hypothetical protein
MFTITPLFLANHSTNKQGSLSYLLCVHEHLTYGIMMLMCVFRDADMPVEGTLVPGNHDWGHMA